MCFDYCEIQIIQTTPVDLPLLLLPLLQPLLLLLLHLLLLLLPLLFLLLLLLQPPILLSLLLQPLQPSYSNHHSYGGVGTSWLDSRAGVPSILLSIQSIILNEGGIDPSWLDDQAGVPSLSSLSFSSVHHIMDPNGLQTCQGGPL